MGRFRFWAREASDFTREKAWSFMYEAGAGVSRPAQARPCCGRRRGAGKARSGAKWKWMSAARQPCARRGPSSARTPSRPGCPSCATWARRRMYSIIIAMARGWWRLGIQHVHGATEDAQPPIRQRLHQIATRHVLVHHVVGHDAHAQAGAHGVAQEGVVARDHRGLQHHMLPWLAAVIGRQPQRPDDGADDGRRARSSGIAGSPGSA